MLFFDDISIGYRSRIGSWQLTEKAVIEFAEAWDPQPFHIDSELAKDSHFGELIASSLHLFAICTRLFFDHQDQIQVMAMMGKDKIRLHNPARASDLLHYDTQCIQRIPSQSKKDRGIIVLADEVSRSDGERVMSQEVTLLVRCRPD